MCILDWFFEKVFPVLVHSSLCSTHLRLSDPTQHPNATRPRNTFQLRN